MKNLIQYTSKISRLFASFLKDEITKVQLITELRIVEQYHKDLVQDKEGKDIWFKFSKDDNLVTTISDLDFDLIVGNKNRDYTIDQIKLAISLQGELLIYFS